MVGETRLFLPLRVALLLCLVLSPLRGGAQTPPMPPAESGAVVVGDRVVLMLRATIGSITPAERAAIVNRRIVRVLTDPNLAPETLRVHLPETGEEEAPPLIELPGLILLSVMPADAEMEGITARQLATRWELALRETLIDVKPLYRGQESGHKGVSFFPLLLVSALAFFIPLIAGRFPNLPVPVVVGEILVGILVGQSGLNLVGYDSSLQFLAEFGFAYLMFLAGMEVDVDIIRGGAANGGVGKRNPIILAVFVLGLTFLTAFIVAVTLTRAGLISQPWLMTLLMSTTSLGLIVPVLKERRLTTHSFGQALLMTALIADFVTMFLITVVAGWISSGPTLKLFLGLLLIVAFLALLRLGRWLAVHPTVNSLFDRLRHASSQVAVRGSLALMLAFVALSETLGTEVILGAFLAGVLLALLSPRDDSTTELREKLEAIGFGFFIPIFFILVGVRFDLKALIASPQGMALAPILIISAFLIKIAASFPFRQIVSWRETLAAGFLMSSRLSLIIAAAEIGLRLGLFGQMLHSAIICVALVTCVGGPLGFNLLLPRDFYSRKSEKEEGTALPDPVRSSENRLLEEPPCM